MWLDAHPDPQVLPGLIYLRNGSVVDLQDHDAGAIDAPAGIRFERHRRGAGYISEAAGLDELLVRLRPRVCFFGHHHTRTDAEVAGVRCIGLNKVAMPGNLVAIDMEPGKRDFSLLGEYPPRRGV